MSKMDNLRAMREARYEQARARGASVAATPSPRTATATRTTPTTRATQAAEAAAPVEPDETETSEALCGHRNMGGRTCTREAGHAARSHRYS